MTAIDGVSIQATASAIDNFKEGVSLKMDWWAGKSLPLVHQVSSSGLINPNDVTYKLERTYKIRHHLQRPEEI
jgi:hypothetical protein